MNANSDCQESNTQDFWGELAPVSHSVQIYENDEVFLSTLESFVESGLSAGESVVIVATLAHRSALEKRLKAQGIDLAAASARDQYIALDARTSLAEFMVNNFPDEARFKDWISELLARAHRHSQRVRAFGEMVAMLWSQGHGEATTCLEQLWNKLCEEETFCLFCAYPKRDFTQEVSASLAEICAAHSRLIAG